MVRLAGITSGEKTIDGLQSANSFFKLDTTYVVGCRSACRRVRMQIGGDHKAILRLVSAPANQEEKERKG